MLGKTSIRLFNERDIPCKVRWINDSGNNKFLHYDLPLDEDKTRVWFHKNEGRSDRYDAVIEYGDKPVGIIGLLSIMDGRAEYYITLGESQYKGKGIARDASILLLKYAFEELKLREVYLYTEVDNIPAQRLFEKCGFVKYRLDKNSAVNRGKSVDRYYYVITASEFREN
ncbi:MULTISPECIES: GNAT family N-acetyltransferase [Butyricimonas]|uniref:GNAT family N-acetyltransferase n=1 Tax=Butyricimonas TaxID=574697 RepID=UPI0007FB4BB4|nr:MULTISPECIES: GNAT family protein [Butyricimonas]